MIRRIFSSYEGFKNLNFHDGLNLLIVDKEEESTVKQTRNSAGKSSLLEIIHFIFGADNDENAFYNKDVFINELFSIEVQYGSQIFEISRCGVKRNRIFFNKKVDNFFDINLDYDDQYNLYYSSVNEWKKTIGEYLFSIPKASKDEKYNPSFRAIFSYFARRDTAGGMIEPKKNSRQQQAYDEQINLSFLLGLDWTLSSKFQELRDREKTLKELKKSLKQGAFEYLVGSPATLRSEIIVLEGKVAEMQANLGRFSLLPEYHQYEDELTRINIEIKENIDKNTIDSELLSSLTFGASEASIVDFSSIELLYAESIEVFPDIVKKRFEEVKDFHNSVIRNRTLYLSSEMQRVKENLRARTNKISQLTQRQTFVMNLLRSHGALDQYNKLNADLVKKQAEVEDLKNRLRTAMDIEDAQPRLDIERAALTLRIGENIEENCDRIAKAVQRFEMISSTLFEKTGLLTVENTSKGISIDVSKQGDKSKGIKSMQIYCFDVSILSLLRENNEQIDLLVHDSHLFDPVDSRQVAHALTTGKEFADEYGFQYIVTMNSDEIPIDYLPENFDIESCIINPRLSDEDNGGLFGIRF